MPVQHSPTSHHTWRHHCVTRLDADWLVNCESITFVETGNFLLKNYDNYCLPLAVDHLELPSAFLFSSFLVICVCNFILPLILTRHVQEIWMTFQNTKMTIEHLISKYLIKNYVLLSTRESTVSGERCWFGVYLIGGDIHSCKVVWRVTRLLVYHTKVF